MQKAEKFGINTPKLFGFDLITRKIQMQYLKNAMKVKDFLQGEYLNEEGFIFFN